MVGYPNARLTITLNSGWVIVGIATRITCLKKRLPVHFPYLWQMDTHLFLQVTQHPWRMRTGRHVIPRRFHRLLDKLVMRFTNQRQYTGCLASRKITT